MDGKIPKGVCFDGGNALKAWSGNYSAAISVYSGKNSVRATRSPDVRWVARGTSPLPWEVVALAGDRNQLSRAEQPIYVWSSQPSLGPLSDFRLASRFETYTAEPVLSLVELLLSLSKRSKTFLAPSNKLGLCRQHPPPQLACPPSPLVPSGSPISLCAPFLPPFPI